MGTDCTMSLKKRGRGAFDAMVVEQFAEKLKAKGSDLDKVVGELSGPAAANTAAVKEAKEAVDAAQSEQEAASSKFSAAQEATKDANAKVDEANKAKKAFEPEYKKATAARAAKQKTLDAFMKNNMSVVNDLIDRKAQAKDAEENEANPAEGVEAA